VNGYETEDGYVLAVPFVQLQTREVARAIVRIEGEHRLPKGMNVRVQTPPAKAPSRKSAKPAAPAPDDLTMEEFWSNAVAQIGESRSEELQRQVDRLLADLVDLGASMAMKRQSPIFVYPIGEKPIQIGRLYCSGHFVCSVPKGSLKSSLKDEVSVQNLLDRFVALRDELGVDERVDAGFPLSVDTYPDVLKWLTRVVEILNKFEKETGAG